MSASSRSCGALRLAMVTPCSDDAFCTIILWQRTRLNFAFTPATIERRKLPMLDDHHKGIVPSFHDGELPSYLPCRHPLQPSL
jgi:hypothetical protein